MEVERCSKARNTLSESVAKKKKKFQQVNAKDSTHADSSVNLNTSRCDTLKAATIILKEEQRYKKQIQLRIKKIEAEISERNNTYFEIKIKAEISKTMGLKNEIKMERSKLRQHPIENLTFCYDQWKAEEIKLSACEKLYQQICSKMNACDSEMNMILDDLSVRKNKMINALELHQKETLLEEEESLPVASAAPVAKILDAISDNETKGETKGETQSKTDLPVAQVRPAKANFKNCSSIYMDFVEEDNEQNTYLPAVDLDKVMQFDLHIPEDSKVGYNASFMTRSWHSAQNNLTVFVYSENEDTCIRPGMLVKQSNPSNPGGNQYYCETKKTLRNFLKNSSIASNIGQAFRLKLKLMFGNTQFGHTKQIVVKSKRTRLKQFSVELGEKIGNSGKILFQYSMHSEINPKGNVKKVEKVEKVIASKTVAKQTIIQLSRVEETKTESDDESDDSDWKPESDKNESMSAMVSSSTGETITNVKFLTFSTLTFLFFFFLIFLTSFFFF